MKAEIIDMDKFLSKLPYFEYIDGTEGAKITNLFIGLDREIHVEVTFEAHNIPGFEKRERDMYTTSTEVTIHVSIPRYRINDSYEYGIKITEDK